MLRIHVEHHREAGEVLVRLEGKLVEPWVNELLFAWRDLAVTLHTRTEIQVDLSAISFVDDRGRAILAAMSRTGCRLLGSAPFIAAVVADPQPSRSALEGC